MEKGEYIYNEKATRRVKIREAININLAGFADFLHHIQNELPNLMNKYIKEVISKCDLNLDYGVSMDNEDEIYQKNPQLINKCINKILSLLDYPKYKNSSIDEEIDINVGDLIKAYTNFDYLQASSLLNIMSREEAINFIKNYITRYINSASNPDNYYNSLEDLIDYFKKINKEWQAHKGTIMITDKNKMILKVNKCRWAEELLQQGYDKELCFSMMCYQDLVQIKKYNPEFTLTRTKTIMQGYNYCDCCYHDIRVNKNTSHPPPKFWESLG